MIDIHSHLIPNIDDGSKNIEETFKMLQEAKNVGFTDIILTPHFLEENYEPNVSELLLWKDKLNEALINQNNNINLYSGMEIYISEQIENLINSKRIITLANSNYMLLELPLFSQIKYFNEIIIYLKKSGIQPIIAHPERYTYVQENPNLIEEYINIGVLIQCNYASILGDYGAKAKKIIKILLKQNQVNFLRK